MVRQHIKILDLSDLRHGILPLLFSLVLFRAHVGAHVNARLVRALLEADEADQGVVPKDFFYI